MWEELLKPGATGAPQLVEWLAIGMGIFLATFLGRANLFRGRRETAAPQMHEIAGAVIDKESADEIVAVVKANNAALKGLSREVANLANRLEQNSEATRESAGEMAEVRTDMKALTREIVNLAARQ